MAGVLTHELVAFNTATASANKIHDDEVAKRFGFSGGLVPGVDVYAYLTHPAAETWGIDWLQRGTMSGRFASPVYDGEKVTVVATITDDESMTIEVRNEREETCATGSATLPTSPLEPPSLDDWPSPGPAVDPPRASPEVLTVGTALELDHHGFHADRHGEYLDAVRDDLALYREARVAHPGWLLRDANYVLSANVRLGPWIHVSSDAQHFAVARDGDVIGSRATVTNEWEHKGHRFVALDVIAFAEPDRVLSRVAHTAIYLPRQVSDSAGSTSR